MNIFCQRKLLIGKPFFNIRLYSSILTWAPHQPVFKQIICPNNKQIFLRQFLGSPLNLKKSNQLFINRFCVKEITRNFSYSTIFCVQRTFQDKNVKLPFAVDERSIKQDILVYSYNNDRFYKLLTFFGIVQFFFWVHLAGFSYSTLRDVEPAIKQQKMSGEKGSWWREINFGKDKYRYGMAVLSISLGYLLLFVSVLFPRRAIKELVLKKGGKTVKLKTFGRRTAEIIPVGSINCLQQRSVAKNQIPMKIHGKRFYFLLDKKGVFHDEYLFDFLIGLKRSLK